MALAQQKNVRFSDKERVDLNDLSAISTLKDAMLREMYLGLLEPGVNGRVFYGFTGAAQGSGVLGWTMDAVEGWAVAPDGSLLEMVTGVGGTVVVPANKTCYLHAYVVDTPSDSDTRRFLDDSVTPPVEATATTNTRSTKVVNFYLTSNNDVTPLLSSFSTSAVISGVTCSLVALYAFKTDGTEVIPGSEVDFRQMWLVNGNQTNPDELPFAFGATDGDRNVKGLRSMFLGLASVVRSIVGGTSKSWWTAPGIDLTALLDAALKSAANTFTGPQTYSVPSTPSNEGMQYTRLVDVPPSATGYKLIDIFKLRSSPDLFARLYVSAGEVGVTVNAEWGNGANQWNSDDSSLPAFYVALSATSGVVVRRQSIALGWTSWDDYNGSSLITPSTNVSISEALLKREGNMVRLHVRCSVSAGFAVGAVIATIAGASAATFSPKDQAWQGASSAIISGVNSMAGSVVTTAGSLKTTTALASGDVIYFEATYFGQ